MLVKRRVLLPYLHYQRIVLVLKHLVQQILVSSNDLRDILDSRVTQMLCCDSLVDLLIPLSVLIRSWHILVGSKSTYLRVVLQQIVQTILLVETVNMVQQHIVQCLVWIGLHVLIDV